MSKQFIAVVIVIIIGLFGIFALTKKSNDGQSGSGNTSAQASEHKKGAGKKGATLIEYGDFQCPHCRTYYPLVKELEKAYGDDITIQFRHFPLTQAHPHAFEAARAAEAAGKQNKFFEMHDLLFENQGSWSQLTSVSDVFEGYAKQLGLDLQKFRTDKTSSQAADTINEDIEAGQAIGVNSTPTFILNGKKLDPTPSGVEAFKQAIDQAIQEAQDQ
ncbi:MAG TPA: thioredoxin domain-containing protein [Candidatus Saccharimonadales bacterium]|nr:thioredoxin domain-containing protein [Candidatus Saccharimonadales bacterium]